MTKLSPFLRFNQKPDGSNNTEVIASQFKLKLPVILVEGSNTEKREFIINSTL